MGNYNQDELAISEDAFNEYWDYVKDDIMHGNIRLPTGQEINSLSFIERDHSGKIKFKNPIHNKKNIINIGDKVSNGSEYGEVIDVDGDLLCVINNFGEVCVWETNDVKVLRQNNK